MAQVTELKKAPLDLIETRQGWFSAKAAEQFGASTYKTPDGLEVEVTCVGSGEEYMWDDKIYVGKVMQNGWLRRREGAISGLHASRSEYSLKSGLQVLPHDIGLWSVKNGVATFTSYWPSGRTDSYNQESLENAIQTVESNRSSYRAYDAWQAHLCQLQRGLSMLIAATVA